MGPMPDVPGLDDPLSTIVDFVTANPYLAQAKLLTRIVEGICTDSGSFSESDTYLLEQVSMALVTRFVDGWQQGRYTEIDLHLALAAISRK